MYEITTYISMLRKYTFHDVVQFTQIYQFLFPHLFTGHLFASSKTKANEGHFVHTWRSVFGKWYFKSLLIASVEPCLFVFCFQCLQFLIILNFQSRINWDVQDYSVSRYKITTLQPYKYIKTICSIIDIAFGIGLWFYP